MTGLRFADVQVGWEMPSASYGPITTTDMVKWAAASGDYNPIHYDKDVALAQGLPGVVIAGPLKLALLVATLRRWIGPRGRLKRLTSSYRGMDYPGDVLTCGARVVAKGTGQDDECWIDLETWVSNQRGERTVIGTARVLLWP